MKRRSGWYPRLAACGLALLLFATGAQAELILSAPPRETADEGMDVYGPIARYLSEVLGEPVVYEHPGNWLSYQKMMKAGRYDIVFDGPHLVSWRMKRLGHRPIARLDGSLRFVVVVHARTPDLNGLDDLVGETVCGLAPPNLATLSVLAQYENPLREPYFAEVRGGSMDVWNALLEGRCDAAVLRDVFYANQIAADVKRDTRVIFETEPFPNQGFSASTRLDAEMQRKLQQALVSPDGAAAGASLIARFKKGGMIIPSTEEEYEGASRIIEGGILAW